MKLYLALLGVTLALFSVAPSSAATTYSVTHYGAKAVATNNDSTAFTKAIAAASAAHGTVTVPAGVWRIYGVKLKSNVTMNFDPGAVVEEYGKTAGPLMTLDGGISNVTLQGVGGRFTLNLDPKATGASSSVMGISVKNVKNFKISNIHIVQNQSNTGGLAPDNVHAAIVYRRMKVGQGPSYGAMANIDTVTAPRGYGPTQITGGDHLTFTNISSDGGEAVRLETDGGGAPGLDTVTVDTASCVNGNAAVAVVPHGATDIHIRFSNITSVSCDYGFKTRGGTDVALDNAVVTAGSNAQVPTGALNGQAWVWAKSQGCYENDGHATLTNITCK